MTGLPGLPGLTGLTVSVVSHGHGDMVVQLLQDFAQANCRIERIIITLNLATESSAELRAMAASLLWPVEFIANAKPLGFGANHNQAFKHATATGLGASGAFAVVNPDIRLWRTHDVPTDPFEPLLAAMSTPQTALAAPSVVSSNGTPEDAWRQTLTPWRLIQRYATQGLRAPQPAATAQWAAGMFWVCSVPAWREVGGFDEGYFMYCEDMDLCLKFTDAGWRLAFVGAARVIHDAQRASHRQNSHMRWHIQSLLRFWRKRVIRWAWR